MANRLKTVVHTRVLLGLGLSTGLGRDRAVRSPSFFEYARNTDVRHFMHDKKRQSLDQQEELDEDHAEQKKRI